MLSSFSLCTGFRTRGGPRPIAFRELRINDQIRIPQVRLFDDTTQEALGIVAIERARQLAVERELDLVEVAPLAQPPVCRLMDYGRYKFDTLKREKDSKREHNAVRLKEMKLRPKISENDFRTKFGYVRHFLAEGDKVKLTIMFRGREMVHQEYGRRLLDRMAAELKDVAIIERNPLVEGRNMIMILSPLAKKPARGVAHDADGEAPELRTDDGLADGTGAEPGGPTPAADPEPATTTTTPAATPEATTPAPPAAPTAAPGDETAGPPVAAEPQPAVAPAGRPRSQPGTARTTRSTTDAKAEDA